MSGGARAGRTSKNLDSSQFYGYHEHTQRIDALLDEMTRKRDQLVVLQAEFDVAKRDLDVANTGCTTGAEALVRILALDDGHAYIAAADIRRAIFGSPLSEYESTL